MKLANILWKPTNFLKKFNNMYNFNHLGWTTKQSWFELDFIYLALLLGRYILFKRKLILMWTVVHTVCFISNVLETSQIIRKNKQLKLFVENINTSSISKQRCLFFSLNKLVTILFFLWEQQTLAVIVLEIKQQTLLKIWDQTS